VFKRGFFKLRYVFEKRFSNAYVFRAEIGGKRLVQHRGTKADRSVIKQIFLRKDYAISRLRRADEIRSRYDAIIAQGKKPLIIDAGANIGASAVWFADQFPLSHIVAFEPDARNFDLLRSNCEGLDVHLHQAAIGSTDGHVTMVDPGEGEWGYQTIEALDGACPRICLSRVVEEKRGQGYVPFLIKIDIEGGEENLFATSTDWVDLFPVMIIELHDWLMPKRGTSTNFIRRIAQSNRDFVHIGENIFSIQN